MLGAVPVLSGAGAVPWGARVGLSLVRGAGAGAVAGVGRVGSGGSFLLAGRARSGVGCGSAVRAGCWFGAECFPVRWLLFGWRAGFFYAAINKIAQVGEGDSFPDSVVSTSPRTLPAL